MGFVFLLHPSIESGQTSVLHWAGHAHRLPLPSYCQDGSCWPQLPASQRDAAQFGMKNAQARNAGFSLKWDAMNNQQEEQEVGAAEAGGKFLSQKSTQALGFLKEKSRLDFFFPFPGVGVRLGCFSRHPSDHFPICL